MHNIIAIITHAPKDVRIPQMWTDDEYGVNIP